MCWYSKHPVCSVPIRGILEMRCMSVCPCLPCLVFTHYDIDVHQYLQCVTITGGNTLIECLFIIASKALVDTLNKETAAPSPNLVNIDVQRCQNWRTLNCIRISYLLSPSRGRMSGELRAAAAGGATEWPAPTQQSAAVCGLKGGRCLNLNNLYCFPQKSCR